MIIVGTGKVKRRELFVIFHGTGIWCYEKVVKYQVKCWQSGKDVGVSKPLDFLAGVPHLLFFYLFSCSAQPLLI